MTLEEGLVALLAAVAGILLFIGLAQALDTRPAARPRRPAGPKRAAPQPAAAPVTPVATELPPRAPYTGPERRRSARPGSRPRRTVLQVPPAPAPPLDNGQRDLPVADRPPSEGAPAIPPVPEFLPASELDPAIDAIERALALQREEQHGEIIETAAPHLGPGAGSGADNPSFSRAALWALVGISRHALGDVEGTQEALEAATREAPEGVSEGCPDRIAAE